MIEEPKPVSEHWVSTSVNEQGENKGVARTCSAEYHVNNVVSPVLFYEALQRIPKDSIVVEVFQIIFKNGSEYSCEFFGSWKR